jgi:hypothetical protein
MVMFDSSSPSIRRTPLESKHIGSSDSHSTLPPVVRHRIRIPRQTGDSRDGRYPDRRHDHHPSPPTRILWEAESCFVEPQFWR